MAKEKKLVQKVVMIEGKCEIIRSLLNEYDMETAHELKKISNRCTSQRPPNKY